MSEAAPSKKFDWWSAALAVGVVALAAAFGMPEGIPEDDPVI